MYTIYIHRFPNNKVYVGCTTQRLEWRFGRNGEGYKDATKIWAAIQEFGWDNIQHEVLATTPSRFEASKLEQYYISQYNSADDEFGYNTRKGGMGKPMPKLSEEACLKIKQGKKGAIGIHKDGTNRYIKPEELDYYLSKGWERGGEPLPEAMKKHLSEINTGKKYSDETKKKLSEMRTGLKTVHKGDVNKKIKACEVEQYLQAGWELGVSDKWRETNSKAQMGYKQSEATRKKHSQAVLGKNVGKKHIHLGANHKMVKPEELDAYLTQGWELGLPKK